MFIKKELEATKDICEQKIDGILEDTESEFTADTLRDLQTLLKLKDAATKKLEKES